MAEMTSYIGVAPRSKINSNVALSRGVRVLLASTGLVAVTDNTVRGDFVTAIAVEASSKDGVYFSMSEGGKVPALASEAAAIGDLAYATTSGKFSKTSANSVLVGRWVLAASGDGVLGEVELFSVA